MKPREAYENLREACVQEAMKIIESEGVDQLSMREVARRLGVSHQAPYKHFQSRDHILAEILRRSFEDFARHLDARPRSDDPHADLHAMGLAYLQYAAQNPLQYQLMFNLPFPDAAHHPAVLEKAQHAFSLLHHAIGRIAPTHDPSDDALFVWSTLHGLASLAQTHIFASLPIHHEALDEIIRAILQRINTGIAKTHG
jgi:AcrR family transcriptional regulator